MRPYATKSDGTNSEVGSKLMRLNRNCDVLKEIDEAYAANSDIESTGVGLSDLPYLNQVINEVLRFYPIAADTLNRKCSSKAMIRDFKVPIGAHILVDVCSLNFDPDLWGPSDPALFDPDRFSPDHQRPATAYLAFGLGPRRCIGQQLALMKMRATIFHLCRRFSIRSAENDGQKMRLRFEPTLAPAGPFKVFLDARLDSQNNNVYSGV